MRKIITTTTVLVLVLCIVNLPAQDDNDRESSKSETSSTRTELMLSGDKIVQPLMEVWYNAYLTENSYLDIKFVSDDVRGDLESMVMNHPGMIMYAGSALDLPEGYWKLKIAREAVIPIYNHSGDLAEQVAKKGLTHEQLIQIFISGNTMTWGELLGTENAEPVHVYMLKQTCGASDVWARFLNTKPESLKGRVMSDDASMVEAVASDPLAIGFCNLKYAFDLETKMPLDYVGILPMDLNINGKIDYIERIPNDLKAMQRVIWLGSYPNNLCRPLWLIADEQPEGNNLNAFLRWMLTDGQNLACKNGYCRLRSHERDCQLNGLKPRETK